MNFELIAAVGLCWILMHSSLGKALQEHFDSESIFNKLFKCALCLGFWCGILTYMLSHGDSSLYAFDIDKALLYGLASAGTCYIFELFRMLLDELITLSRYFTEE